MIRIFYFLVPLLLIKVSNAQVIQDDFSEDGLMSFWMGDRSKFAVNPDFELQLADTEAGSSNLYAEFETGDSMVWEFLMNMNFSPSNTNYLQVYLLSTSNDLENSDAYFIRIGENGSTDAIRFFKRVAGTETELMSSTEGIAADAPNFRFRIIRRMDNSWSISADLNGGFDYQNWIFINDDEINIPTTAYFGLACNYTSTRADQFYFDDILAGPILPDTQAPSVTDFQVISSTELRLDFDEAIDDGSFSSISIDWMGTYSGNASFSTIDNDPTSLLITLDPSLNSPSQHDLIISGAQDLAGNAMNEYSTSFEFIEFDTPTSYDILITEIMADPSPAIGLPDAEYIEIYNNSDKFFNLQNYMLVSGNSEEILQEYRLAPNEYLLLIDQDDIDLFDFVNNKLSIEGLFGLSNSGDDVALFNDLGQLINRVDYDISWYQSSTRSDGGYSLEMKAISNPCLGMSNWSASDNLAGGTPGMINSVFTDSLIDDGPKLISAFAFAEDSVRIKFDRALGSMDWASFINVTGLSVDFANISVTSPEEIVIKLSPPLSEGQIYDLEVDPGIEDCAGFAHSFVQLTQIALPVEAEAGDLLINEILSDPFPGASDFIEIYNTSSKVIAISGLALRNDFRDETVVLNIDRSIFPDEYIALSDNISSVLEYYTVPRPDWLVETEIPSFNNDEGNIQLGYVDLFGLSIIDEANYDSDMHYEFLDDTEGISLERISSNVSALDRDNWYSAAASVGYATPTGRNSQAVENSTSSNEELSLTSTSFSPDQDGFEDLAILQYSLSKPGFKSKVEIFSDEGRMVKSLAQGLTLGTSGTIKWSGLNEDNEPLPIGIYIFAIELVHPDGDVVEELLPIVLSQRF